MEEHLTEFFNEAHRLIDRFEQVCDTVLEQAEQDNEHSPRPMPSLENREVLGDLDEYPDMMQVSDIQEIFQIGNSAAYRLVKTDGFPSFRLGNSIRIPKHGLHLWANTQVLGEDLDELIEEAVQERMDSVDLE